MHEKCMSVHDKATDCKGSIEYEDTWETITFGAYRYGECSACGRTFREYYNFIHVETPDIENESGEPTVIFNR